MSTTPPSAHHPPRNPNSPPLPKKVQWHFLYSKLDNLPVCALLFAVPRWLDLIDPSILLTSIAKLRSELELLESETAPPAPLDRRSPGIRLPDYDQGTFHAETTSAIQKPALPMPISGSRLLSRRARKIDDNASNVLESLNTNVQQRDGQTPLTDELSPLSPTFGPRKGLVLSGTVERRRRSSLNTHTAEDQYSRTSAVRNASPYSATFAASKRTIPCAVGGNMGSEERRILWEAAWTEIEQNVEVYADRFEGTRCTGPGTKRLELWIELVALLGEKRALCRDR